MMKNSIVFRAAFVIAFLCKKAYLQPDIPEISRCKGYNASLTFYHAVNAIDTNSYTIEWSKEDNILAHLIHKKGSENQIHVSEGNKSNITPLENGTLIINLLEEDDDGVYKREVKSESTLVHKQKLIVLRPSLVCDLKKVENGYMCTTSCTGSIKDTDITFIMERLNERSMISMSVKTTMETSKCSKENKYYSILESENMTEGSNSIMCECGLIDYPEFTKNSSSIQIEDMQHDNMLPIILGVIFAILILIIIAGVVIILWKRNKCKPCPRRKEGKSEEYKPTATTDDGIELSG